MAFSFSRLCRISGLTVAAVLSPLSSLAQSLVAPTPLPLDSLGVFRPMAANWQLAGGLGGDPRHDKALTPTPGTGVLVNNPTPTVRDNLLTTWEHGDLELDLDFLMPTGSNSGVYLQGRYEVQLFDSWGVKEPKYSDCGGIYHRWDDARGKGKEGYEGHAPRANACRAPGLWQHLHIEFRAPRFDATGRKTANARFVKVVLNGFVVQEDVEVTGPTRRSRANAFEDEKPLGPLMIQGDHGPIALRAITYKRFDADAPLKVEGLAYKLYPGDFAKIGDYDSAEPKSAGTPARFSQAAVEKSGKFALVFTGSLVAPREGAYGFSVASGDPVRLLVDGKPVVVPLDRGGAPGAIALTSGAHAFRLDYLRSGVRGKPVLDLVVEGPGFAPQKLTVDDPPPAAARQELPVEPKDRVLLQRGFVPYEPKKRLYAASVGTPAGVHYAYDFETGALLRVWRGDFLDTFEMWDGRGENQIAKPAGPSLTLNAKPTVALIEFPQKSDWPDQPDAMQASQGYSLEQDGLPVFRSTLSDLAMTDRIAPAADGLGLTRTLTVKGQLVSWEAWVLLAHAEVITPQPDGRGWIIGDRGYYLDWPADSVHQPIVRTRGGRQQLVLQLKKTTLGQPIIYTLVW